jgi:hypothetical protein
MNKYAVLLNTDTEEVGQTVNGLEYAIDLDGAATQWPGELQANPDNPVGEHLTEAVERGLVAGACSYCASTFETTDEVASMDIELLGDGGHGPSVGSLVEDGHELITTG